MDIATIIGKHWNSRDGLNLTVRKGSIVRRLHVPNHSKWDVMGYAADTAAARPECLLRGDARGTDRFPYIRERGRTLAGFSVPAYLADFELVRIGAEPEPEHERRQRHRDRRFEQAHRAAVNRVHRWVHTQYGGSIDNRRHPLARLWRQAVHRAFARAHKRVQYGPRYHSRWAAACQDIIQESRERWSF